MSKKMDIYSELDNFVEENEGQVTLTDVAKHFAEHGYQYAVDKAQQWIDDNVLEFKGESFVHDFKDCLQDFRKAMEELL
jgi:hypothetical protein